MGTNDAGAYYRRALELLEVYRPRAIQTALILQFSGSLLSEVHRADTDCTTSSTRLIKNATRNHDTTYETLALPTTRRLNPSGN